MKTEIEKKLSIPIAHVMVHVRLARRLPLSVGDGN